MYIVKTEWLKPPNVQILQILRCTCTNIANIQYLQALLLPIDKFII